jgi:hypothetical protein
MALSPPGWYFIQGSTFSTLWSTIMIDLPSAMRPSICLGDNRTSECPACFVDGMARQLRVVDSAKIVNCNISNQIEGDIEGVVQTEIELSHRSFEGLAHVPFPSASNSPALKPHHTMAFPYLPSVFVPDFNGKGAPLRLRRSFSLISKSSHPCTSLYVASCYNSS